MTHPIVDPFALPPIPEALPELPAPAPVPTAEPAHPRPTLYKISADIDVLYQEIAEAEGELTEDLEARFDALTGAFNDKVAGWVHIIRHLLAVEKEAADEVARLNKIKATKRAAADRMKVALMQVLKARQLDSAGTPLAGCRRQQNSVPTITFTGFDAGLLPPDFRRVVPETVEPDIKAVMKAYADGDEYPSEFFTVERGEHLRLT